MVHPESWSQLGLPQIPALETLRPPPLPIAHGPSLPQRLGSLLCCFQPGKSAYPKRQEEVRGSVHNDRLSHGDHRLLCSSERSHPTQSAHRPMASINRHELLLQAGSLVASQLCFLGLGLQNVRRLCCVLLANELVQSRREGPVCATGSLDGTVHGRGVGVGWDRRG